MGTVTPRKPMSTGEGLHMLAYALPLSIIYCAISTVIRTMVILYAYNGHLRGPITLTTVAERLSVKLSLPVFKT